jgi:hypothetical protein
VYERCKREVMVCIGKEAKDVCRIK